MEPAARCPQVVRHVIAAELTASCAILRRQSAILQAPDREVI
jgi:hypothetical protein